MTASTVWELPCRSQEFMEGPAIRQGSGDLALAYDFETDTGAYTWEEMTFIGVAGFRFTAARFCTPEQISSYDKLQELDSSSWTSELSSGTPASGLRHYRIFFDDVGCYEVLSTAFVPPAVSER